MLNTPFGPEGLACQALGAFGERALAPLQAGLQKAGPGGQMKIIQALRATGLPALNVVLRIFLESDGDTRFWAAFQLGKLGLPAHETLLSAYRHAPLEIRRAFAKHILLLGRPSTLVDSILADGDARVRLSYNAPLHPPLDPQQFARQLLPRRAAKVTPDVD